jgi:hypothetical protein
MHFGWRSGDCFLTRVNVRTRAAARNGFMRSPRSRSASCPSPACRLGFAFVSCLALASCATVPQAPNPILTGRTQELAVRSDPPGASCSFTQDGKVVATIESTPGTANVPRDFTQLYFFHSPLEGIKPMEVVCRKDGFLERRATFAVVYAEQVALEEAPPPDLSPEQEAGKAVGSAAVTGGAMLLPQAAQAAALAAPAAAVPIAAAALVVVLIAAKDAPPRAAYAYRALPEFFLIPATFDSAVSREAFFAALDAKLHAARDAQRARIDAHCRFWPCKADDPAPCQDLTCKQRRERVDVELRRQLDELPALRAQTRIAVP